MKTGKNRSKELETLIEEGIIVGADEYGIGGSVSNDDRDADRWLALGAMLLYHVARQQGFGKQESERLALTLAGVFSAEALDEFRRGKTPRLLLEIAGMRALNEHFEGWIGWSRADWRSATAIVARFLVGVVDRAWRNKPAEDFVDTLKHLFSLMSQFTSRMQLIASEMSCRVLAEDLDLKVDHTVVPLLDTFLSQNLGQQLDRPVLRAIFKHVPAPVEATPLEAIFEIRNDTALMRKREYLRMWMITAEQNGLSLKQAIENLEYLLHDYEDALCRHRLSLETSVIESWVIPAARFIDAVKSLNLEELVKSVKWVLRRFECNGLTGSGA